MCGAVERSSRLNVLCPPAKAMAACAGLRHLDVGHNALGAGFAREIAASPTLVSIRVFDNKLGDEGSAWKRGAVW